MATYFISDIHLSEQHPHLLQLFEQFTQNILKPGDTLYVLGDLFEYWIGDDQHSVLIDTVKQLLKSLALRNISWYFLAGNRDFLLGKKFLKETHGVVLPEKKVIYLGNQKILLLHGDTLCTNDFAYQAWRRRVNHRWVRFLFLCLPLRWRYDLASRLREKSMAQGHQLTESMMNVTPRAVAEDFSLFDAEIMIHGHVHRPGVHLYGAERTRYVLADWDKMGNYLVYDGQFSLNYFE